MRTTLSLDDDVAALLAAVQNKEKKPFKEVVNEALREGLRRRNEQPGKRVRFRTKPARLGRCLLPDLDNIAEVLTVAEGEAYS